jgi:hypothetical protein
MLWAEVETDQKEEAQFVYSVGTGHGLVPDNCRFIGSVQEGPYVWHIYSPVP